MNLSKKEIDRNRRIWIKELEDGKRQQTKYKLCDINGRMCCLGVLIDAVEDADWELSGGLYGLNGKYVFPDTSTLGKVNLSPSMANKLAQMNDQGKTFKQIAAYLRKNWRIKD